MYKIRLAGEEDFPALFPLAKEFYATTKYAGMIPMDFESTRVHYNNLVNGGYVLIAEEDGKAVGMLGCYVSPFYLNNAYKVATESMWYLDPSARGTTLGRDLIKVAEEIAEIAGCRWIVMSALSTSPPAALRAYEALEYASAEVTYMKELKWPQ